LDCPFKRYWRPHAAHNLPSGCGYLQVDVRTNDFPPPRPSLR
jgi:hypothetical protein